MKPCLIAAAALLALAGCPNTVERQSAPSASTQTQTQTPKPEAGTPPATASALPAQPLMPDAALGALVERLSERPGDFPSDNFVSNETSYLDVVRALRAPALRGRAYVGVGPEQNLTYLAILDPEIAYIVDIRRGNMLEHMVLRASFEASSNRVEFVSALTSRPAPASLAGQETTASAAQIAEAFAGVKPEAARSTATEATVAALMDRVGVALQDADRALVRRIVREFHDKGLSAAYSMQGSNRKYPGLGALLAQTTDDGEAASFLGTHAAWARVRALLVANRVVPLVGDFAGSKALPGIAADMRDRGVKLGVFYTSNVEQYLVTDGKYGRFIEHVRAMPTDDASLMLRVWFDQGRKHPQQRPGHRTTSVVMPVSEFLGHKGWRTYWEVATWEAK
jgi:hypothetical protein